MKKPFIFIAAMLLGATATVCNAQETINKTSDINMKSTLNLTQEWDKVFPKSDKVDHQKVTFHNRYGIELQPLRSADPSEPSRNSRADSMRRPWPSAVS